MSTVFIPTTRADDWRSVGVMGQDNFFKFKPQSDFPTFDHIRKQIKSSHTWIDATVIAHPTVQPDMIQPEKVPAWVGCKPRLYQRESGDGEDTDFSDVQQGNVGNCWFMSALAGVANIGKATDIITRSDEKKGIYEVRLWTWDAKTNRVAQPLLVCVDRRVPVLSGDTTPRYCFSDEKGELWPSIIEKAFAKAILERDGKSGYAAMDGGLSQVAVIHLLGGVAKLYKPPGNANRFDTIKIAEDWLDRMDLGHILGVGFKPDPNATSAASGEPGGWQGLVAGHAYSVLNVVAVPGLVIDGKPVALAQLRNPWGERGAGQPDLEWRGDWGDSSPLWTTHPEAKQAAKFEKRDDGVFWISMADIATEAQSVSLAIPASCPFTLADREDLQAIACWRCGEAITEDKMMGLDAQFHKPCITCVFCDGALEGGFDVTSDNHPAHDTCLAAGGDSTSYKWHKVQPVLQPGTDNRKCRRRLPLPKSKTPRGDSPPTTKKPQRSCCCRSNKSPQPLFVSAAPP